MYVRYTKVALTRLEGPKMASSTLTIRVDDDLKREAAEVADYYGLDLSSVTRDSSSKWSTPIASR